MGRAGCGRAEPDHLMANPGPESRHPGKRPRRVCIAPNDTASYYSGLQAGLRSHGIRCWFFCFELNPYARYQPDDTSTFLEHLVHAMARCAHPGKRALTRHLAATFLRLLRVVCLGAALLSCDVFVFGFGRTFLRRLELPLLRLLGKRIIFVFNGSDTRPVWMSGAFLLGPGRLDAAGLARETLRQKKLVSTIERYAHEIVCHPLSAQLLTKPFVNHLAIGHPFKAGTPGVTSECSRESGSAKSLRILHAPTSPLQKGSAQFSAAVERLRNTGVVVSYTELTKRPNSEVLAQIAASDLVLDELYSDIPLAGLGTETAASGRALLVGGYGREEIIRFQGEHPIPTSHYIHPDQLNETLLQLASDPSKREKLAAELQTYARDQWTPEAMASRFARLLVADIPDDWRVDPQSIRYWQGWGAPESVIREGIARLIDRAGADALGINHNPELKAEILRQSSQAPRLESP